MSLIKKNSNESVGNVKLQLIAGIIATLSSLTQGTTLTLSAIVLPQVQDRNSTETLYLSVNEGSWFASLYSLGCLSGALIGGFQSDFFGRKRSMMIDNLIILTGASLIVTANSFYMLIFGRYLGGYGIGSCMTSLPAYLSEISHPHIRGTLTGIFGAMYYVGCFLLVSLGALLPWRVVICTCAIVPLTSILGLSLYCQESPVWLLRHGKKDEAKKTLVHFRGSEEEAERVLATMEDNLNKEKRHISEETEPTFMLRIKHQVKELTCPTFWKPFTLIMFLLPVVQNWAGMPFITFYMVTFIKKMKIPMDPYMASSVLCLIRLILSIVSVRLLTQFSKKKLYLSIVIAMIIANASLAIHQILFEEGYFKAWMMEDSEVVRWLPFASIALLYGSISLGFGTITRTLQGELLPAKKRSIGCGIIGFFDGLSIFTVVKISPALSELIHVYGCFIIFTIDLIMGFVVTYFFLPETKGHSLEEIERYYYDMKMQQKSKKSGSRDELSSI